VVFDVSFMSGTTLGDRCSPFRGSTVPTWSVLNLSKRQLLAVSKASASRQTNGSMPLTVPGHGKMREAPTPPALRGSWRGAVAGQSAHVRGSPASNGFDPRGRGHYSGSPGSGLAGLPFRNAPRSGSPSNGFASRGRAGVGSTATTRGGYTGGYNPIDRGDNQGGVVANNPNFRPKPQQSVPPPSSLNVSNPRGRGRGGRGGRGGQTRGSAATQ